MIFSRYRKLLTWLLILLIAAAALYLACRGVQWSAFIETLSHVQPLYLIAALLIASLSFTVRGQRWKVMLSARQATPFSIVFMTNMIGYLGNFYLPVRVGEIMRSVILNRKTGISTSYILATALTERILDAVALVVMSLLAVLIIPALPSWFFSTAVTIGAVAIGGIIILYLAARFQSIFFKLLRHLPVPDQWHGRFQHIVEQFLLGTQSLHQWSRAGSFAVLTLVIWLLDAFSATLSARALLLSLTIPQAIVLSAGLGISSAVPSAPGGLGIYQLVAITILISFGFSRSNALAYILLAQACSYLIITFWGMLGSWYIGVGSFYNFHIKSDQFMQDKSNGEHDEGNSDTGEKLVAD